MSEKIGIKRTRKSAPKSRQGCRTCKFRRVKCDEHRPACLRCLRWGIGTCGGYPEPAPRLIRHPPHQVIQPKLLQQPQTGPRFKSEEEHRHFQFYSTQVSPNLGGAFDNSLWDHIIAQACVDEPFVLYSVTAIGALARAISSRGICSTSSERLESPSHESSIPDYENSLRLYDKAIKAMRSALANGGLGIRKAMIACLLVFCFETHIGNQASAIHHAQSGIALLHQWQLKEKALAKTAVNSSTASMVEDQLVRAVGRLDLQVSILLDLRPLKFHQAIKKDYTTVLQHMPSVFVTLDEARVWCELTMRLCFHFRAESMAVGKSHEIEMKGPPMEWEDAVDTPMGANVLHDPKEIPVALLPEYRTHILQMNRWSLAFQQLYASLRASRHKDLTGATLVLLQAKMSFICLASAFSTMETLYDDFMVEFHEIMALAESVYETLVVRSGGRLLYHFDGGIIPPLFLVATKCRDRALRRQAIARLSSSPWREGVFDSICCGKMATWIMGVEEEGITDGDLIPEHRRLRIRRSNIDLPRRRAQLQGTQFATADDVEPEWKEHVVMW